MQNRPRSGKIGEKTARDDRYITLTQLHRRFLHFTIKARSYGISQTFVTDHGRSIGRYIYMYTQHVLTDLTTDTG